MSHCHALTKGRKRCRQLATIADSTTQSITYNHVCKKHEHFFDSFQLTEELVENLEYYPGLHIFLRDAIREGLVCVKEFIVSLPPLSIYAYFYLVCVNNAKVFNSSWNPALHKATYDYVWYRYNSSGAVWIHSKHLFLLAALDGPKGFYEMLVAFGKGERPTQPIWLDFFDHTAKQDFFQEMYHVDMSLHENYLTQTIDSLKNSPKGLTLSRILDEFFMNWFTRTKRRRYAYLERRLIFKEELLEVAWEPSRMAWYLDEEQKTRLKLNWRVRLA
jgi:hypothetical protein